MKKLLLAVVGSVLLVSGCNVAKSDSLSNEKIVQAENDYKVCASCHGTNLEGGKSDGGYREPLKGFSKEAVLQAIKEGPGIMPANMVTDEAAENLAAWIATK